MIYEKEEIYELKRALKRFAKLLVLLYARSWQRRGSNRDFGNKKKGHRKASFSVGGRYSPFEAPHIFKENMPGTRGKEE